ncbi:MAG TPA: glucosyl-3-phosphoglycerate synthase [Pseudonocardiaceae bacterium]
MLPATEDWFRRRTWHRPCWTVPELVRAKAGRAVSVVLPALDEERTVGAVVAGIAPLLGAGLVDELVVLDSGCTDRTAERAAAAGARVVRRGDVLPGVPVRPGKGEALWRSLAATTGDLVVFVDADLVDPGPGFVPALLGPALTVPGTQLVKGCYRRPLDGGPADGGGRVTEIMARPLLAALRPELAGVVQPLGGEYAVSREFAESVPFAAGYGVEVGLLLDAHARYGLDALAQVNLGERRHRNRSLAELGVMAHQVAATVLDRCAVFTGAGTTDGPAADGGPLTRFVEVGGEWLPDHAPAPLPDRPPLREVRAGR